jgi:hypothetical protein
MASATARGDLDRDPKGSTGLVKGVEIGQGRDLFTNDVTIKRPKELEELDEFLLGRDASGDNVVLVLRAIGDRGPWAALVRAWRALTCNGYRAYELHPMQARDLSRKLMKESAYAQLARQGESAEEESDA